MSKIGRIKKAVEADLKRLVDNCHNSMTLEEFMNYGKPKLIKILIYV